MKRSQLLVSAALFFCSVSAFAADQGGGNMAIGLLKALFGLLAVLAMMAASAWVLKRFGIAKASGSDLVKIVGGVSIGNRERVLVVEVGDQWIVVGVAPGQISSLATLPKQEQKAPAELAPAGSNFSAWLKQTIEKRNAN